MNAEERAKAHVAISIVASVVVVLHVGLFFGGAEFFYENSFGYAYRPEISMLVVVPTLVVAAVFTSAWLVGKLSPVAVIAMLPGLMIAHPYVMWFSWVMFLSAVAVAFVAGRDLGQGQSSGPAWRAQALLVLPVVVLSGFVAALFGSGVVKSSRVISAELLHLDPVLLVGLLVALSAFAAGVYRQVPWAALLALALHAAAHVAVFANSSFHDELVILVVAGLSFVAGLTSRKPAVASNWPADQTAASAREVAQPDAGDRS